MFHLQVSSPPYDVKTKDVFNLWNKKDIYQTSWIETNKDIHTKISMKTVNGIFALVEKVCKKYDKNPFWRNVLTLMNEGSKYKTSQKQNHNS